jgi:ABC-type Fe3+ transport system permease subunit
VIITISWILLASPSTGVLNYFIESITGVKRALNIYSFWGMVWVQSLEMAPLAYLLMSAAMQSVDPRLEEASAIAGAGGWSTLYRVSLPLILPATAAAALLLFIQTVESFEVPLLLGGRARFPGVYDGGLFQHGSNADGLGTGEHVFDDAPGVIDGVTVRLFSGDPAYRALPDHYGQRLQTATH